MRPSDMRVSGIDSFTKIMLLMLFYAEIKGCFNDDPPSYNVQLVQAGKYHLDVCLECQAALEASGVLKISPISTQIIKEEIENARQPKSDTERSVQVMLDSGNTLGEQRDLAIRGLNRLNGQTEVAHAFLTHLDYLLARLG
jgi:hypothetical protein